MTILWLIVWLVAHTPAVQMFGTWNTWGIALAVCVVIDLLVTSLPTPVGAGRRKARSERNGGQ